MQFVCFALFDYSQSFDPFSFHVNIISADLFMLSAPLTHSFALTLRAVFLLAFFSKFRDLGLSGAP